jgi:hypothetical protein
MSPQTRNEIPSCSSEFHGLNFECALPRHTGARRRRVVDLCNVTVHGKLVRPCSSVGRDSESYKPEVEFESIDTTVPAFNAHPEAFTVNAMQ